MQIQTMSLSLKQPKMDMPEMQFNHLMILIGANGTGKTLVLKFSWVLTTIAAFVFHKPTQPNEEIAQYIFNSSFDDMDFDGDISINYTNNARVAITLKKGKVIRADVSFPEDMKPFPPPIFMSTTMRTFTQVKQFLKTKKLVSDLSQLYKLYDIVYVEVLSAKLSGGFKLPAQLRSVLTEYDMDKYDIQSFDMDDENVWFMNSKGKRTDLATLSNGEQAVLNMFLGNYMNHV